MSALKHQEGGDHYKKYAIQPIDFIYQNNIPFIEGNIIKYVVRHRDKNKLQDLLKAKHNLEILIEKEYGTTGGVLDTDKGAAGALFTAVTTTQIP